MKVGLSILAVLMMPGAALYGQALPTATGGVNATPASTAGTSAGFRLPGSDGEIHYALGASQIVQYGFFGSSTATGSAALNGNLGYSSLSAKAPFDMVYSGGVLLSESTEQNTSTYQALSLSQGVRAGKWVLNLADSVSLLPQSPTVGFAGLPGVGGIGGVPGAPDIGAAGALLTYSGNRVSNVVSGSAERMLTGTTSVSAVGSYSLLHFLQGADGYDTSGVSGEAALNHRLDGRDTVSVNAVYSLFTFGKNQGGINFATRGINGVYTRLLSRTLSLELSAGPQWVSSSDSALIPNNLSVAASVGLGYVHGLTNAQLGYSRGVNGGSGIQLGGVSDTISGGLSHSFGRRWFASANGSFSHTKALATGTAAPPPGLNIPLGGDFKTVYGGAQVSHSLSRTLSMYLSFASQHQTFNSSYHGTNAFGGTSQTFAIGITYAPRSLRLGQF